MSVLQAVRVVKTPQLPVEDEDVFEPEPADWEAIRDGGCDLPGPVAGVLSFADWISVQASYYRSLGSDAADWLAREIEGMATTARFLGANNPNSFDDRLEVLEDMRRA